MTQALNRCVSCLPGQRDVDNALRAVGDASKRLLSNSVGAQSDGGMVLPSPLDLPRPCCRASPLPCPSLNIPPFLELYPYFEPHSCF